MSTAATPDLAAGGDSSTSVDPIESLDLSNLTDDSGVSMPDETQIPDEMLVGGKKREPATETETTTERERAPDGKFAKKDAKEGEEQPVVEAPKPLPFRYRAMGNNHELEGATEDADGNVMIPAAKKGELREAYNALHQRQATFVPTLKKLESENAQLKQQAESKGQRETQASQIIDMLGAVMTIADPSERLTKMWEFSERFPQLKLEAEAKFWKEQATRGTQATKPEAAPQQQTSDMPSPAALVAQTKDAIDEAKIHFPALTDSDWQQIEQESSDTPFAFYRLATAEDAKQYQVQVGQVVFDTAKLKARIAKVTDAAKDTEAQRAAERKRVELAQANARKTQPSIAAPPSVTGGHAPAPKRKGAPSQKEIDDWFNSDKLELD